MYKQHDNLPYEQLVSRIAASILPTLSEADVLCQPYSTMYSFKYQPESNSYV